MTYTRAWDNSLPLGSTLDASDIDGEFRRLKTDISERFTQLFASTADSLEMDSITDLTVKSSKSSFIINMQQGLLAITKVLQVDKTVGGIARMILGNAGGGSNYAWTILPCTTESNFPPWEAGLVGLVAIDSNTQSLVAYTASGTRCLYYPSTTF